MKPLAPAVATSSLILIVDDQPANLKVLRGLFANMGHRLTFAASGQQALERARSAQPDLILLDLMLPDMSGLEVCQRLKQAESTADIPIIFLTASHELDHLLEAFEQGAVDYVTKPFRSSELLTRVRHHLLLQNTKAALAEINHHLEEQVQQRTAQLRQALTFTDISQRIIERVRDSLDETQILSTVVHELTQVLALERAQTGLYNVAAETSTITQDYAVSSSVDRVNRFADYQDIYNPLLQGETIQRLLPATPAHQVHQLTEAATLLACPLQHEREIIGDLWLYRLHQQPFSDNEIQLVEHVAAQSAIAIRQARFYRASQAQVEELERLNYAKDDFLKTISHELKTPLTTIKAAAGTLGILFQQPDWRSKEAQIAQESLNFLNEGCDREIQIVNNLLELVHLDIGTVDSMMELTDIPTIVEGASRFLSQRFSQRNLTLKISLSETLPLLLTHAEMLERILLELLDNACKYTPPGGKVEVAASHSDRAVEFTVSNSDVTLPDENLDRMFETFYRLPQPDRWQHDGVGLGLALVKKQVDYLGGSISPHYDNRCLTFKLSFPLRNPRELVR